MPPTTTEETIKNQITAQVQLIADATNQTRLHVYKLAVMGYLHHLSAGQIPPVTPTQPFKRKFTGLTPGESGFGWNPTFVDGPELLGSPLATYVSGVSGSTAGTTLPDPATLPPNVFAPGIIQPGGGMSALPNDTIPDGTVVFHNGGQWKKRVTPWGGVYLKVEE